MHRTEAIVDLAAIAHNVGVLKAGTDAAVLAVVKADGYGHGLIPCARAALAGGATWLGTAVVDEALALRAAGLDVPILSWLWTPQEDQTIRHAVAAGIDLSVSSTWQLGAVVAAGEAAGVRPRVHLKIDTGLSRNGCYVTEWPALVDAVAAADVDPVAIWSHFAYADSPGHSTIARQIEVFDQAVDTAAAHGVHVPIRHLANSAATLTLPAAHYELVRPGLAVYGLNPVPDVPAPDLRPAMTLRAAVSNVKTVHAGEGVSYGHTYHTDSPTTLALVPLGYADGVPRAASNKGPVQLNGAAFTVSGRVCMDQFVVDVGDHEVAPGDVAILFGSGVDGGPTAQDWAEAADTIDYEIITRIGPRVARVYIGEDAL